MGTVVTIGTSPAVAHWMRFGSFRLAEVNRAVESGYFAAGKAVNAGRAAATAGADVICVAPAGGKTGEQFGELLARERMGNATSTATGATRVCTTIITPTGTTELVEEPPVLAAEETNELIAAAALLAGKADCIVAAGRLAPGVDQDFYTRVMRAAAGRPVVLDAKGPALMSAVVEAGQRQLRLIAKPNMAELLQTFPGMTPHEALSKLMDEGAWAAVITDGPGRVLLAHGEYVWVIHPPHVQAVSPIGAGDTLAGVLAAGLIAKLPIEQAVAKAAAAASASCLTVGPAVYDPVVAETLGTQVRIDAPRLLWRTTDL